MVTTAVKTITITRIFDAPRELVWEAWTDPEQVKQWWGPKNYNAPASKIDLRDGGRYVVSMQGPDGKMIWSGGVYKKIDPPNELVMTDNFTAEDGNVVPASHYDFEEDFPEGVITVHFEDLGGKTKMTLTHEKMPVTESEGATQGWNESFDKLVEALK